MIDTATPLMEIRGLTKRFPAGGGVLGEKRLVHAVDDVSFSIATGEILALVGESGSGKSTIARLLARLHPPTAGTVLFDGEDALRLRGRRRLLAYRRRVQMVFQDPFASLNPVKTVAHHIERPLLIHRRARRSTVRQAVHELLDTVGLTPPDEIARKLPHELSGGQRQRVSFARALAVRPAIILADEPVSMLDVSIRMGVLNMMRELRERHQVSCLFITHDLASARYVADRTLVLYAGHVMEEAASEELMAEPLHPYTRLLLSAVPDPKRGAQRERIQARGEIPAVVNPAPGCRFAGRCPHVMDICRRVTPHVTEPLPGRRVRCHLYPPDVGAAV